MISNTKINELPLKLKYKLLNGRFLNVREDCMFNDGKILEQGHDTKLCQMKELTTAHASPEFYYENRKNKLNFPVEVEKQFDNGLNDYQRSFKKYRKDEPNLSSDEIYQMLKKSNNDTEPNIRNLYLSNDSNDTNGNTTVGCFIRQCIRETLFKESFNSQSLLPFSTNKFI